MATVLMLSGTDHSSVLPSLSLLAHRVTTIPAEPASLVRAPSAEVVMVDARQDLQQAKALCRILQTTGMSSGKLLGRNGIKPD